MKRKEIVQYYIDKYKNFSNKYKENELVIMVGVPGSGKTTTAKAIESTGMARIATDDLKMFFPDGGFVLKELFSIQYEIMETLMKLNISVIADSNSDKQIYRDGLITLANKYNYAHRIIYCYAKRETIYKRMEERKKDMRFFVSKEEIDRFFEEMEIPEDAIHLNTDLKFVNLETKKLLKI